VDLAKKVDRSCLVVTEMVGKTFICRDLGRLPAGLDYTVQATRIGAAYQGVVAHLSGTLAQDDFETYGFPGPSAGPSVDTRAAESVWVLIDASGVGEPVIDGVRKEAGVLDGHLMGVGITGGTGHNFHLGAAEATVSKQYLVSQLKALTGFNPPLLQLPRSDEAKALAAELEDFEMQITDSAHPQWGAAQGRHDDMIMALALSTLPGSFPTYKVGSLRYA